MHLEPESLTQWLEGLKRESIETSIAGIDEALEAFADAGLPALQLVPLLERIRMAVPPEIVRAAKAWYADRPLPLAAPERSMLVAMQGVFTKLSDLYWMSCLQFERDPEGDLRNEHLAASLQRCVHALVSRMIEDYRARQVIEPGVWLALHRIVDKAGTLGVDKLSVPDELNPTGASTVDTTYGRAVLLAAAQAGAMTPRTLDATLALTGILEPFIDCSWKAGDAVAESSSVTLTGRLRVLKAAGTTHLLNNTRLAGALNACSQKLAAGEPVASLDVLPISRSEVSGLLARLHRVWCGTGEIRGAPRERTDEHASVASGVYAIYRLACGAPFAIPREFHVYATGARPGEGTATLKSDLAESGEAAPWRILDRSGEGLRAARDADGGRLTRGCLMGIRIEAGGKLVDFSLGEVRWVQEDANPIAPNISAGIKLLPGKVQPAVMRGQGGRDGNTFQEVAAVFLLEQTASPKLIVPTGWWKVDRIVDIWRNNTITRLRMGEMVLRGADFETGRFFVEKAAAR